MRAMVEKLLRRYGSDIQVTEGTDTVTVRGFLQPVTGRSQSMARLEMGPLGMENGGQYVYIGPLEPRIREGCVLKAGGREFLPRKAEIIGGLSADAYQWVMCVERGAEDTWGSNG